MNPTRYRVILVLLGLTFIAVIVGAVLISPSGRPAVIPDVVERVAPQDGDLVLRQTSIEVKLQPRYRASFVIDGVAIPQADVLFVEATGLHIFEPGQGKAIAEWTPGTHRVLIEWDRLVGLPDPGSYRWVFRAQ